MTWFGSGGGKACPYCNSTGQVPQSFASTIMIGYSGWGPNGRPVDRDDPQLQFDLQPPPLLTSPIEAGELIGYRVWALRDGGGGLYSLSAGTFWTPGEVMTDRKSAGEEIGDTNAVGIWAFKDMTILKTVFAKADWLIYGSVWMWGVVIEHEQGYRVQYAAVRSLDHCGAQPKKTIESGSGWSWFKKQTPDDQSSLCEECEKLRRLYGVGGEADVDKFFPMHRYDHDK